MGVTIHYEGQLTNELAYDKLILAAKAYAEERGWPAEPIESKEVTLLRVRDEKDWDYTGPVKGIAIYPHADCDSIRLEFDRDLYMQEFTKTQFAGAEIHLKVLGLLKAVNPFFRELKVNDEGEYWDTGDLEVLTEHLQTCQRIIEEEFKKNPSAQMKVKTPDGKIVDLIT